MKKCLPIFGLLALSILVMQCSSDDDEGQTTPAVTVTTSDFSASIAENPNAGAVIGSIQGSTNSGTVTFTLTAESVTGAFTVNSSSGQLTVANETLYDFETNPTIFGSVEVANGTVKRTANISISVTDVDETPPVSIWSGTKMTFTKADGADPMDAANQDMITAKVILGRLNNGGQLINFVTETDDDKVSSPAGTQWSAGTTANMGSLTFGTFRELGPPKSTLVGNDFVLKLVEEDILIDIKFLSWSSGNNGTTGGFSYERSTQN